MRYDPQRVHTVVDGTEITGFAEGTMITASRMEDKRDIYVGAQGNHTFTKNANDAAEVTITLQGNSQANSKLEELYNQDEPFSFACVDQNVSGDVSAYGSECVVQSLPDFEKGGELEEREWTLIVANYEESFDV